MIKGITGSKNFTILRILFCTFIIFHSSTVSALSNCGTESVNISGVIVSMHNNRYRHTEKILNKLGFHTRKVKPVNFQSSKLQDFYKSLTMFDKTRLWHDELKKTFSNFMTFHILLRDFAIDNTSSPEDWRFFFEDDIVIHGGAKNATCNVLQGMKLAKTDGILYLGLCGPTCLSINEYMESGVAYSRCYGTCAHAFGITKWKAETILDLMLLLQEKYDSYIQHHYFDRGLFNYGKRVNGIYLVGSNLNGSHPVYANKIGSATEPVPEMLHYGIVFQDRNRFPTTIG